MLFDGHSDILYALERQRRSGERDVFRRHYLQNFQRGKVEGGIFVLWGNPEEERAVQEQILQQLQTVQAEVEAAQGAFQPIYDRADLLELDKRAETTDGVRFLLGVEGLDGCAQDIDAIEWLYAQGVRHVSLTWNGGNAFAAGINAVGGLTALGRLAVRRIQEKGMLLDVSHLNDLSLRDVLWETRGPLVASHSNSRSLCDVPRNVTDAQAKAIAATGGLIGINSHPPFIAQDKGKQDLEHLSDHAAYLADLVGVTHVAFGFDLNYWEENGTGLHILKNYAKTEHFLQLLERRGFSKQEIAQLARENFLCLLGQVLT